jgi:fibronectin type 3 domain-containing protein
VQPSQVFEKGLEIAILPSAAQAVSGYRVLRSQTPGGPYELVGETTGNVHYDLGLTLDQTYCYVVQSYDRSGLISPNSQEVCNLVPTKINGKVFMPLIMTR